MALLYQHEKQLLMDLAEHYEDRASHCSLRLKDPNSNKLMYRKQRDKELEKARVLRKAAS